MTNIAPKLTPYWFTPEDQEGESPARFKLRPLTQPQIVDVMDRFVGGKPTMGAWYAAGEISIIEVDNLTINGEPAKWPKDKAHVPWVLVTQCGIEAFSAAQKADDPDTVKN